MSLDRRDIAADVSRNRVHKHRSWSSSPCKAKTHTGRGNVLNIIVKNFRHKGNSLNFEGNTPNNKVNTPNSKVKTPNKKVKNVDSNLKTLNSKINAVNSNENKSLKKVHNDKTDKCRIPLNTTNNSMRDHLFLNSQSKQSYSPRISINLIDKALRALGNYKGSTVKNIFDYLVNQGHMDKSQRRGHLRLIGLALTRGWKFGSFVRSADGHRYRTKYRPCSTTKIKRHHVRSLKNKSYSRSKYLNNRIGRVSYRRQKHLEELAEKKKWLKKTINSLDFRKMMDLVTSPSPIEMVRVGGVAIPALIDTGAVLSIMSPDAYAAVEDVCPLITQREAPVLRMINPRAANNSPIPIRGLLVADVTVGHLKVKDAYIVVMKHQRPPPTFIVGMNIIKHLTKVKIDKSNNKTNSKTNNEINNRLRRVEYSTNFTTNPSVSCNW